MDGDFRIKLEPLRLGKAVHRIHESRKARVRKVGYGISRGNAEFWTKNESDDIER